MAHEAANEPTYEVDLAQRRYENVDPANRLVAATLERRWNDALARAEEIRSEFDAHQASETSCHDRRTEERSPVARARPSFSLGISPPPGIRTANASSGSLSRTSPSRGSEAKKVVLHLRWQGGAREDIPVYRSAELLRSDPLSKAVVDRVRVLAQESAGQRGRSHIERRGAVEREGQHGSPASIVSLDQVYSSHPRARAEAARGTDRRPDRRKVWRKPQCGVLLD